MFGVATVFLVYQVGMRWGARHALLAAGLMAVLPLHVRYSHYVLTDTPLTFFVTLTFLLSLSAHERGTLAGRWHGRVSSRRTTTNNVSVAPLVSPRTAVDATTPVPGAPERELSLTGGVLPPQESGPGFRSGT